MPSFRRGDTYFFTVSTFQKRRFLTDPASREAMGRAIAEVRGVHPFEINAWVLLPDHLHTLWTLPPEDWDYSRRWGLLKARFTRHLQQSQRQVADITHITRKPVSTFWQRQFWQHEVRDEQDYRRHLDFIHNNPVRHGLVAHPVEWPYSTFRRYVSDGLYPADWVGEAAQEGGDFGE